MSRSSAREAAAAERAMATMVALCCSTVGCVSCESFYECYNV
jgi:hypothetical protein